MKLVLLLHFYQPHNQQDDILHRIVHECYLPLTQGLLERPKAKLVVNISGALTELLMEKGYGEVVENLRVLSERRQIELTGSAKFHAFLPLIPESEIERQIELNNEVNSRFIGESYKPSGFFSPEMTISDKIIDVAGRTHRWLVAADVGHPTGLPEADRIYKIIRGEEGVDRESADEGSVGVRLEIDRTGQASETKDLETRDTYMFFRHKRISSLMLSASCRTVGDLIKETTDLHDKDRFWFGVMDAETFGHHRIGHEKFLFDVLDHDFFETMTASELLDEGLSDRGLPVEETEIRPSTWTNEEQDFWLDQEQKVPTLARSFILWQDPDNPIHKSQWELTELVISEVNDYTDKQSKNYTEARDLLDKAIASDQYWWASAKPWWSLEMIEQGAYELKKVLITLDPDLQSTKKAEDLYREILDKAFKWQRTGYIRKKHLENSATFMKKPFAQRTPSEWYNQIILEFDDEMRKAAENMDFEKAVKWRDAVIKLKRGTDMFDVLHVVDELWSARTIPSVKPFLEHDWEEFSRFARDNFLEAGTKEEFEAWKKRKKL
jgi:hypothetical protein